MFMFQAWANFSIFTLSFVVSWHQVSSLCCEPPFPFLASTSPQSSRARLWIGFAYPIMCSTSAHEKTDRCPKYNIFKTETWSTTLNPRSLHLRKCYYHTLHAQDTPRSLPWFFCFLLPHNQSSASPTEFAIPNLNLHHYHSSLSHHLSRQAAAIT